MESLKNDNNCDEEDKVSSNDTSNKVKLECSSTSSTYVILQIRPNVYNMYIAPFYFTRFIHITEKIFDIK